GVRSDRTYWMVVFSTKTIRCARAMYCSTRSAACASTASTSAAVVWASRPAVNRPSAVSRTATATALRVHVRGIGVRGGIGEIRLDERVVALATFAADTAMHGGFGIWDLGFGSQTRIPSKSRIPNPKSLWVHARQRQIERDADGRPAADDVGLADVG